MPEIDFRVVLEEGKYAVIFYKNGKLVAERYGAEWRDLTGDGLVYALAAALSEAEQKLQKIKEGPPQVEVQELLELLNQRAKGNCTCNVCVKVRRQAEVLTQLVDKIKFEVQDE